MKKYLKAIIALEIYVLLWQYYFRANFIELEKKKQVYANMYESNRILEQKAGNKTKRELYLDILKQQRIQLKKEKQNMEKTIPDISITRSNIFAPFDEIKENLNNEIDFKVIPDKEYREEGNLIYWKYELTHTDTVTNIIKLIAAMESTKVFLKFLDVSITSNNKLVDIKMQIEIAYRPMKKLHGETK